MMLWAVFRFRVQNDLAHRHLFSVFTHLTLDEGAEGILRAPALFVETAVVNPRLFSETFLASE